MTLLLGFAAVNTGNNLLYLLVSALLGFMTISGWLGQQNLRHLQIKLTLPTEIFAGQPTLIGLAITNQRRYLPAFLIRVKWGESEPLFVQISAQSTQVQDLMFSWPQRGAARVSTLWIDSCFPINFFVRSLRLPLDQELLIFPQPLKGRPPCAGEEHHHQQQRASKSQGDSGELRAILDYQGGEPLKNIHWKLSARHTDLKVKHLEGLGSEPIIINLAALPGPLEEQLSQACGLIIAQLRHQQPVGLTLGEQFFAAQTGTAQRRRLLTALALHHVH